MSKDPSISRLLLDTHTFLWWDSDPDRLSDRVLALCRDPSVSLFLRLVSLWEIRIKSDLGKLPMLVPLTQLVEQQQAHHALHLMPITATHIYALAELPTHHRDSFDRLLIAQAFAEGVPIASFDPKFASYPVDVIW